MNKKIILYILGIILLGIIFFVILDNKQDYYGSYESQEDAINNVLIYNRNANITDIKILCERIYEDNIATFFLAKVNNEDVFFMLLQEKIRLSTDLQCTRI